MAPGLETYSQRKLCDDRLSSTVIGLSPLIPEPCIIEWEVLMPPVESYNATILSWPGKTSCMPVSQEIKDGGGDSCVCRLISMLEGSSGRKFVKLSCLWITEVFHVLVQCAQLKELRLLPKVCVKTQELQLVTEHNLMFAYNWCCCTTSAICNTLTGGGGGGNLRPPVTPKFANGFIRHPDAAKRPSSAALIVTITYKQHATTPFLAEEHAPPPPPPSSSNSGINIAPGSALEMGLNPHIITTNTKIDFLLQCTDRSSSVSAWCKKVLKLARYWFMKLACLWITQVIHVLVRCAQLKELLLLPKVCVKTQEPQLLTEHNNLMSVPSGPPLSVRDRRYDSVGIHVVHLISNIRVSVEIVGPPGAICAIGIIRRSMNHRGDAFNFRVLQQVVKLAFGRFEVTRQHRQFGRPYTYVYRDSKPGLDDDNSHAAIVA
ncbi:hypothetical protein NQ318_020185 [Aromia moschata]|uniref:Uncharacterized protein n=1 Tax=Aromia moschata TaxID=1265417 RepID=A0AAV8ZBC3_9CUCU|nr:hypothetical protein NQ318_020185 [Aromia moschata]